MDALSFFGTVNQFLKWFIFLFKEDCFSLSVLMERITLICQYMMIQWETWCRGQCGSGVKS
jgi:hypothetical protein